ncbi:MAG: hypothetical protein JXR12_06080 [Neptunomonas phycophila]|uniref:hypothetical protein n=1 Tax=Neptunomonas phycophila TaxID=1572645 RepID=UPI003B8E75C8
MKKTIHPLEQYKFEDICDFDFTEPPCADFRDADGHPTAMDMKELNNVIEHCTRYGLGREVFVNAKKELEKVQNIYDRMQEPDNIPIQR